MSNLSYVTHTHTDSMLKRTLQNLITGMVRFLTLMIPRVHCCTYISPGYLWVSCYYFGHGLCKQKLRIHLKFIKCSHRFDTD